MQKKKGLRAGANFKGDPADKGVKASAKMEEFPESTHLREVNRGEDFTSWKNTACLRRGKERVIEVSQKADARESVAGGGSLSGAGIETAMKKRPF